MLRPYQLVRYERKVVRYIGTRQGSPYALIQFLHEGNHGWILGEMLKSGDRLRLINLCASIGISKGLWWVDASRLQRLEQEPL